MDTVSEFNAIKIYLYFENKKNIKKITKRKKRVTIKASERFSLELWFNKDSQEIFQEFYFVMSKFLKSL